ncbi:hypothetical protein BATDEDRAFT_89757 [Batrachochytrium dendrobatidis JAM81]|uniref:Uncharacterized protein n=2 Tax=Batrachochytrium dendrobatidis TaxID=109871 RepID=F4P5U5_BATDJ|nr:uncharacterized protein BATDEDRAFT_89757 [Batrachochytrium dendrobatidis JAM81]EGF79486.1 hypothetical protein BATDEDRAFT_89757 [Batrachochytrium dendrobatidis JAM81]KAK5665860.1 hypothetical protein QVD99_007486 [Batrachochytrium dendrobatidis]OAJ42798.1 hypothetical protein, variant [Batrachochytrium dendrobatidis JEL423]|eukprot:XP_006680173.1 hypothetical protein BATDEDRAFT_89757 [Batrachochytrium dendrobatidis JAM81]
MPSQIDGLVEQAQKALESCEPGLAIKFLQRAIQVIGTPSPSHSIQSIDHAKIYQLLGWAHMEIVNTLTNDTPDCVDVPTEMDSAKQAFLHAIKLAPNQDYSTYLYLGQLSIGKESIAFYELGVRLLDSKIIECKDQQGNDDHLQSLQNKMGSALCSMIEIYMTDCCDEPEAEEKCEEYIQYAIEKNPTNPEVFQTLASIRLSQSRPDEAKVCLEKSMDLWYVEPNDDEPFVADPNWPAHPLRISLSKLLMETNLHERALAVLQTCQVEDDEEPETWYLFGWCYRQLSENQPELIEDSSACFDSVIGLEKRYPGSVDPAMLQHISELMNARV